MRLRSAPAAIALAASAFLALAAPRPAMAGNPLDDAAACAGSLIGNATVDLSQGRDDRFDEGVDLAYAGYLTHIFAAKGSYKQADVELADKILAVNTDREFQRLRYRCLRADRGLLAVPRAPGHAQPRDLRGQLQAHRRALGRQQEPHPQAREGRPPLRRRAQRALTTSSRSASRLSRAPGAAPVDAANTEPSPHCWVRRRSGPRKIPCAASS